MTLFLLFIRYLPAIAISEVKGVTPQADPHYDEAATKALAEQQVANENEAGEGDKA